MNILVVDDTQANITLISAILEREGHTVFEALSSNEAIEIMTQEKIQIALVDWMMPGMDGLELTQYIRNNITSPYIYIMLLTGKEDRDAMVEALEAGVDVFIKRPFTPRELRAHVKIGERIVNTEAELIRLRDQIETTKKE